MNFLHWIVLLAFAISRVGGDRWDCPSCGGGPANTPGGLALDTCAGDCLQAAPAGSQCDDNTSSDCICNGAHFSLAIQAIANCAMASCIIVQDLAAATSVASTWCAQWSKTAAPPLVTPYTNIPTTPLQTLSTTTHSQGQPVPTQTPAGSGGGNSGLSRGDKIALGVGIGLAVVLPRLG